MASTATEVFVIGGQDTRPCGPAASCLPGRIRRDGAALNLATATWRTIAPAPIPLDGGHAVVIDGTIYVLAWPSHSVAGKSPGGLLQYDIAEDRWSRSSATAGENDGLAVIGDGLLIYTMYDESGRSHDRILDRTGVRDLPPDPLAPSGLRSLVPVGDDRLILFAHDQDDSNGARPTFVLAAELDLRTLKWRQLPKSNIVGGRVWWLTDGLLVAPEWGLADGGKVNGWGKSYPEGGILDPESGRWQSLPTLPLSRPYADGWSGPAAGGPELLIVAGGICSTRSRAAGPA